MSLFKRGYRHSSFVVKLSGRQFWPDYECGEVRTLLASFKLCFVEEGQKGRGQAERRSASCSSPAEDARAPVVQGEADLETAADFNGGGISMHALG